MEWWSGGVVEWWSGGVVEWWSGGVMGSWPETNKNRGYQQLRVWQDAITLYVETCQLFKPDRIRDEAGDWTSDCFCRFCSIGILP